MKTSPSRISPIPRTGVSTTRSMGSARSGNGAKHPKQTPKLDSGGLGSDSRCLGSVAVAWAGRDSWWRANHQLNTCQRQGTNDCQMPVISARRPLADSGCSGDLPLERLERPALPLTDRDNHATHNDRQRLQLARHVVGDTMAFQIAEQYTRWRIEAKDNVDSAMIPDEGEETVTVLSPTLNGQSPWRAPPSSTCASPPFPSSRRACWTRSKWIKQPVFSDCFKKLRGSRVARPGSTSYRSCNAPLPTFARKSGWLRA